MAYYRYENKCETTIETTIEEIRERDQGVGHHLSRDDGENAPRGIHPKRAFPDGTAVLDANGASRSDLVHSVVPVAIMLQA